MSVYRIFYKNGAKMMAPVETEEEYRQLRGTALQGQLVSQARLGNVKAKRHLLQFCYSCIPGENGALKGCETPSNSVGMDVDLIAPSLPPRGEEKVNDSIVEGILSKREELGLLMLERSATKGFHLVFRRHPELSQEENLKWASQLLGVPYDEGAKDITRVFFSTTDSAEDLIYLDKEIFDLSPLTHTPDTLNSVVTSSPEERSASGDNVMTGDSPLENKPVEDAPLLGRGEGEVLFNGIPYADLVHSLEEKMGGIPEHGSRNNFIFTMACHLRYVCNNDPEWIARVLPTYGEERGRWWSTIQSACKRAQSRSMSNVMRRAIATARTQVMAQCGANSPMPELPKRLPPLIRLLTSKVPDHYKPAVAMAVFPALAAHLYNVRFRYVDNSEVEPAVMNVLIAPQSSGKSCVNKPIEFIMADIKGRDELSRQREQEWKDQCNGKGANKDKPARPDDLCIQYVLSDLTNAALVTRLADANGHFLYSKMNEIELLRKVETKNTRWSDLVRLAYDCDDYGQERSGTQSVTARTQLRWNWNASTTPVRGEIFFKNSLQDGTVSRLCFSTIVVPDDYDELIPKYGIYDQAFAEKLRPYIDELNSATGEIRCRKAEQLALELLRENKEFVDVTDDDSFNDLQKRATVEGYIKAMILYIAHGCKWSSDMAEFVRWAERYDLWCKMQFFYEQMSQNQNQRHGPRGPVNMLAQLPDQFTEQECSELRVQLGKSRNAYNMLHKWISRGYITYDSDGGKYCKTAEFLQKSV